jgi:quercetin dioxygenase-like cupin family protein
MRLIWLAGALALLASPVWAEQQAQAPKAVTVTPVMSTTTTWSGQPIVLPQGDAQVVVTMYDILPGVVLPVHKHPYPRYGYVLSGTLRVTNVDTGQSDTFTPGAFIVETVGQWHMGSNIGSDPVKLLIMDFVEKGQPNTVLQK